MELIIAIVICLLIGNVFSNSKNFYDVEAQNRQNVTNATRASAKASSNHAVRNNYDHSSIDRTLRLVKVCHEINKGVMKMAT
jgi:hypothetical protein